MYCPKCGAEGDEGQSYCRRCGVNLALVGKAVTVSEAIARGDSGLLPKIKSVMGNLKLDGVSEQVVQHVEMIGREVEKSVREQKHEIAKAQAHWWTPKTPEERRAKLFEKGFGSMFGGIAMMIVFYFVARNVAFNFPPEVLAKVPFDLYALINLAWLFGLIPALTGLGQVIGAFMVHGTAASAAPARAERPDTTPLLDASTAEELREPPASVTERTTAHLDYERTPASPDRRSTRA